MYNTIMATISPLDNRYSHKIIDVIKHFDIFNFTKCKLLVECEYLKFFCSIIEEPYDNKTINYIFENFDNEGLKHIEKIETITNHDIQALVQYIQGKVPKHLKKWVHYGLTSQDINSCAMVIMHRGFNIKILHKDISNLVNILNKLYDKYNKMVMLSFTHGQPATPTTFGKQMKVFISKLNHIGTDLYKNYRYRTKFGGSNGALSGLKYSFPDKKWDTLMSNFTFNKLHLYRNEYTTQIDDYVNYFKLFQIYERLCYILINLCQDMWMYVHKNYLKLKNVAGEIGSSAMPHKVNPIHFENAEGNFKMAAGLFHTIGTSICLSRMQRDLTDSTILRNVGVACGHLVLAIRKLIEGLNRVALNEGEINLDLYENTAVLMEFFQLKLRQWNITDGYNICKQYSRGKQNNNISTEGFIQFLTIHDIILDETQKKALEVDFDALLEM